jgi:hypothetical protein
MKLTKWPLYPDNPGRPPLRYQFEMQPGDLKKRMARLGVAAGHIHPNLRDVPVEPDLQGEFWGLILRLPGEFSVPHMANVIRSLNWEPARIEHLLAFAEHYPQERAHFPLIALDTTIWGYIGDSSYPTHPAILPDGNIGVESCDYRYYIRDGGEWIDEDLSLLCLSRDGEYNTSERSDAPFKYPTPRR